MNHKQKLGMPSWVQGLWQWGLLSARRIREEGKIVDW